MKSSKLTEKEKAQLKAIRVKLGPRFGVSERVYVPVLWLLAVLLVLGAVLVFPGLQQNGTWIKLNTAPLDAQIIINDVRKGPSGEYYFVPRGKADITVRKKGFESRHEELTVKGRVLGSLFFPRRITIFWHLESKELKQGFLSRAIEEFADWTTAGEAREHYALPPVLTQGALDFVAASGMDDDIEGVAEESALALGASALPLARDVENLADVMRGGYVLATGGAPVGLDGLVRLLDGPGGELLRTPGVLEGLARTLEEPVLRRMGFEDWIEDNLEVRVYDADGKVEAFGVRKALEEYAELRNGGGFSRITYGGGGVC